jgi:hypothetical protein
MKMEWKDGWKKTGLRKKNEIGEIVLRFWKMEPKFIFKYAIIITCLIETDDLSSSEKWLSGIISWKLSNFTDRADRYAPCSRCGDFKSTKKNQHVE